MTSDTFEKALDNRTKLALIKCARGVINRNRLSDSQTVSIKIGNDAFKLNANEALHVLSRLLEVFGEEVRQLESQFEEL